MSLNVEIQLKRPSRIYHEGENVTGYLILDCKSEVRHDGITMTMDGVISLQLSAKSAGLLESFVNSSKPIPIVNTAIEVSKSGKIPSGKTEIPFEIPLQSKSSKTFYETYHGVYVIIQYSLRCDIKRSLLAKDVTKAQEFIVEYKPGYGDQAVQKKLEFEMRTETLTNVTNRARIPGFVVRGHLDSSEFSLSNPLSGELTLCSCERGISSIELQLVRIETCGSAEGNTREASEIQNIQIADGDVCRGRAIPIYMVFPRLFTCATTSAPNFKIEFELNIVIIFDNDHLVVETFPLKLTRY